MLKWILKKDIGIATGHTSPQENKGVSVHYGIGWHRFFADFDKLC